MGMSEQWVVARTKQKGDGKCIPWNSLIYGLVVFPKALRHMDEAISNLVDRLDKRVMSVPVILVETFRSLNACRRAGDGRFIGCA
ncbi:hypothetical protein Godav_028156 [Gossypium davidsonii]|uniref:Uncharacterized protein n=1 Tax=Gossypium davidsonii TaxID=34287 RepID=A0A7J8RYJ5_GOSDV|nr:hypothetical protein [Gossypium davidsonii]